MCVLLDDFFSLEMRTIAVLIWIWCLTIVPFTAILTFILTLVTCSQIPHNPTPGERFPQISQLGTGEAYYFFVGGFIILLPQLLIILVGRIQLLFQTQYLINRGLISFVHGIAVVSAVFLLIMVLVSADDRPVIHVIGAFGMFICISIYCFLHTILVIYLYKHRMNAPQCSNLIFPIWFFVCSLLIIIGFIV